jgi:hypothetical protein
MDYVVYWLYDDNCICYWRHGYIGITNDEKTRIRAHKNRFGELSYRILFCGSKIECCEVEYQLRPHDNIGWNIAPGGNRPAKRTAEWIAKLSKSKTGQHHSSETKEKLRLINLGKLNPHKGRVWTEDSKAKLRGYKHSAETLEKKRVAFLRRQGKHFAHYGRKQLPEAVAKRVAANTGKRRSAETRARMKAIHNLPENKERSRIGSLTRWQRQRQSSQIDKIEE